MAEHEYQCPSCGKIAWVPDTERVAKLEHANAELRARLSQYQREAFIRNAAEALATDQMFRVDRHREADGVLRVEDMRSGETWRLTITEEWVEEMGT